MKEETEHKQGKSWKIVFRTRSYEEADAERKRTLEEFPESQVKVKFLNSQDQFVVKVREPEKKEKKK